MVVAAVLDILDEAPDDGCRDDVSGVVRLGEALESHADHLAILQHRATGVARVDRRIDLHDEVGIRPAVGVWLEIDARDDALGYGQPLAADGIADDGYLRFEQGHVPEGKHREALEVREVLKREDGEIAIVRDEIHLCWVFLRRAVDGDEDALVVRDHVGVGEDLVFSDEESGADPAAEASGIPWDPVVGGLRRHLDAQDRFVELR